MHWPHTYIPIQFTVLAARPLYYKQKHKVQATTYMYMYCKLELSYPPRTLPQHVTWAFLLIACFCLRATASTRPSSMFGISLSTSTGPSASTTVCSALTPVTPAVPHAINCKNILKVHNIIWILEVCIQQVVNS